MTMLTVDDLARDLKVKNEDLLRELMTMGFQVEGPESPLETDDPAALRAQLVTVLPQREVVEQRIRPTVIRRRVKKAPPGEEPEAMEHPAEAVQAAVAEVAEEVGAEEPVREEGVEALPKPTKRPKKTQAAKIIEMAPRPAAREVAEKGAPTSAVEAHEVPKADKAPAGEIAVETPEAPAPGEMEAAASPADAAEIPSELPVSELEEVISAEEARAAEEKPAKKKKKKEKKMQPAQIIGRVVLKKEPVAEPERVERPQRPEGPPRPPGAPPRPPGGPPRPDWQDSRDRAPRAGERPARPHDPRTAQPPRPPRPPAPGPMRPVPVTPDLLSEEEKRRRKKKERESKGVEERVDEDKLKVRRRKEVILGAELYDERGRGGRYRAKGKKAKPKKTEITVPKASKRRIKLPDLVSVAGLAHKISTKVSKVVQHLMTLGVTATVNEEIDYDTAAIVVSEFGYEAEHAADVELDLMPVRIDDEERHLLARSPVITVMGHVDHGKTSLLDAIRSTHVTDQEAGGITQHIGAHKVKLDRGEVVFLDTPGHEAFTAMRSRGAQVTDFVVLVVAADDGVMEQTKEAINHSRAANVPIIVAVNKIDKPEADRDRVMRELSEHDLIPEAWGGDTLFTYVSAKTGEGIQELLELLLLQAELMELKANPDKPATGTVIEARLDKGKGPVATVLVKDGTLKLGDAFVAGFNSGKLRAMLDHEGRALEVAGPATPIEVQGFAGVPEAGDLFVVVDDEKIARQISEHRAQKQRQQDLSVAPVSLEDLLARMKEQETKELNIVLKADVQGSVEAVREALVGSSAQEIKVKVIHSGVGGITESDVMLASASQAIIIGFNVRPTPKASQLAEQEKVDLRMYTVIYEATDDIRKAMEGMLAPVEKEVVVGRVEVRQTFHIAKIGLIAGCYVTSGKIERSNQVRLIRDEVVMYQGRISSMKRFKDDIKEAVEGYECGLSLENYRDVKVGDIIEAFTIEKETAKLH
jgi:translation initiation factor IF-2